MLLYRDMNEEERAETDRKYEQARFLNKRDAEQRMADWDEADPEYRAWVRLQDEKRFKEGGLDPYIVEELSGIWG